MPHKGLSQATPCQGQAWQSSAQRERWLAGSPRLCPPGVGLDLPLAAGGSWTGHCQSSEPQLPHPKSKKADCILDSSICPSADILPRAETKQANECSTALRLTRWETDPLARTPCGPFTLRSSVVDSVPEVARHSCPVSPTGPPIWQLPMAEDQNACGPAPSTRFQRLHGRVSAPSGLCLAQDHA